MNRILLIIFTALIWIGCEAAVTPSGLSTVATPTITNTIDPARVASPSPANTITLPAPPTPALSLWPASSSVEEVTITQVSQMGGGFKSIALARNIIFAGQGARLIALDISNPSNLHKLGETDILPGLVENVIVQDSMVYITAGKMLMRLDGSDPTRLVLRGQIELPAAGQIVLRDTIIYAGGPISEHSVASTSANEGYIAAVDISGDLKLLDMITIRNNVTRLALAGEQLFIGHEHGILKLDISDPADLGTPGRGPQVNELYSLRIYGDTLLVGAYSELLAFDVSDPQASNLIWREEKPELGTIRDFAVLNHRVYTVGWQPADAFIPTTVAIDMAVSLPAPDYYSANGTVGIIAADGYLYRMDQRTLAIENGSTGALIGSYTAFSGGAIALDGDVLYAANRTDELITGTDSDYVDTYHIPELSPLKHNVFKAVGAEGTRGLSSIVSYQGSLYLFASGEMCIVSPNTFVQQGVVQSSINDETYFLFQYSWRWTSIPIVNDSAYLYGANAEQEFIVRFDVSNPTKPAEHGRIPLEPGFRVLDMDATEDWLVVSLYSVVKEGAYSVVLYDLTSDILSPVAKIDTTSAMIEVRIKDNILLTGSGEPSHEANSRFELFSLPNLVSLGQVQIPSIHEIGILNDFALITMKEDSRLLAVDISDPAKLHLVGAFDLADTQGEIVTSEQYVVVGNEDMGLYVLTMNQ